MTTEQQVSRGMYLAQSKAAEDFFEEDIVTLQAFAVQQEQARGRAEANARGLAEDVQAAKNRGDRLAEMVKEFEAERDRLRAQLDEIRKLHLHRAPRSDLCRECMREYPCPTLLSALDAAGCLEEK